MKNILKSNRNYTSKQASAKENKRMHKLNIIVVQGIHYRKMFDKSKRAKYSSECCRRKLATNHLAM